MIIDCHGHYTTAPRQHEAWRAQQIEAYAAGKPAPPRSCAGRLEKPRVAL